MLVSLDHLFTPSLPYYVFVGEIHSIVYLDFVSVPWSEPNKSCWFHYLEDSFFPVFLHLVALWCVHVYQQLFNLKAVEKTMFLIFLEL